MPLSCIPLDSSPMNEPIRIIGIDPGLRRTGWGIITSAGAKLVHVADGTLKSDTKADLSSRLLQLHDQLAAVLAEWSPHEAAVEETFVNKDARATLKLGQARGIALFDTQERAANALGTIKTYAAY